MGTNITKIVKRIAQVTIGTLLLIYVIDNVFNRFFADWFYSLFMNDLNGIFVPNWSSMKMFIKLMVLIGLPLLYLLYNYFMRKRMIVEKNRLQHEIIKLIQDTSDSYHLDDEYAGIESQIAKLKLEVVHQQDLYERETSRKNDLITYLAHDLKTPLASVIGYLSFLSEAVDISKSLKEKYTNIALDKAFRLEMLIDQFFEITRFNLQTIVINREKMDIRLMLEQVCDECYPIMKNNQKEMQLEIANEGFIYLDTDKFGRVLTNLLRNAISYSYDNTAIQIHEKIEQQELVLQIINEGDKIPEHKLDMLFEKFYRMDEARSSRKGGAGLGLAIAKSIVEAHQGVILAASDDRYTTFTVRIPLYEGIHIEE